MNGDPLALFHEWVDGDEMVLATATSDGRPSVRALLLKSADERGFSAWPPAPALVITSFGQR